MAIKLTNLEQISKELVRKDYIYKDLKLDFAKQNTFDTALNRRVDGNDIKVDYDESAIKNSLRNLFNTMPGQRFLFPLYGLDLNQYIFEAVTEQNGQLIGEKIAVSIERYEPRVALKRLDVIAKPDNNEYEISIIVEIPAFNTTATINTLLDTRTKSFIFLETSRNR